jgi:hypothetical protein
VGTDQSRELLAAKDWFFSDIHRALLTGYYQKNKLQVPKDI